MIKGGFCSESLLKKNFQITIQIRDFEFAGQTVDNFFKFSAQDSDLKYFLSPIELSNKKLPLTTTCPASIVPEI